MSTNDEVSLSIDGKIATITLNVPQKLNALTQDLYYKLAQRLRQVAKLGDVFITVLTGKGRYFSASVLYSLFNCIFANKREQWRRRYAPQNPP